MSLLFSLPLPRAFFCLPTVLLCLCGPAAARPGRAAPAPDVLTDFGALARQHPWDCAPEQVDLPAGWDIHASCAWRNRLRVHRWHGPADAPGACVSVQARWWNWARGETGAPGFEPWRREWRANTLSARDGAGQRIVALAQDADGSWRVTEWRWQPSARLPTRRWQAGRWALLAARADALRASPVAATAQAQAVARVLAANLGGRSGEIDGDTLAWSRDGLCLRANAVSPGPQVFELSYAVDDSRLEQRAAMQLQLARRFPKAVWLTPFSMIAPVPHARGGAKFYAVWREGPVINGQLWMPVRGSGPAVRLRFGATVPERAGAEAVARAQQIVTDEMMRVAARWASEHD